MNYKDAILKDVKFKSKGIRWIKDGKSDLIITVPMTAILDAQAKYAFSMGAIEVLHFVANMQQAGKQIDTNTINGQLREWGIIEGLK